MRVSITAATDGDELGDLYHWLRDDAKVARSNDLTMNSSGQSGSMGALDVIDIVLSNATSLTSLALAFASWRKSRSNAPAVTFTYSEVSVTVRDGSPEDVSRIVALVKERTRAMGENKG